MAVDRNRLAAALAYEEERRRRMMESVPTTDNLPPVQPSRRSLRTDLENLSSGIGQGVVNQLEGVKALVTDPVGTARAAYEGVKGIVRDPSVLADALRYTAQKATSGPLGAGEVIGEMVSPMRGKGPMAEIDVYHGSPHRFEEFDASKIGTGEGAQAFGHGIYFAQSPNVAQDYQFRLSKIDPEEATYQGKPIQQWYDKAYAEQNQAHRSGNRAAIDKANAKVAFWENMMTRRHPEDVKRVANDPDDGWPEFANYANSLDMKKFGGLTETGSLYTADLPDEMVDRMLDWDKPLSEQPEVVRQALLKLGDESSLMTAPPQKLWDFRGMIKDPNVTGQQIHSAYEDLFKSRNVAGRMMQKAGIPGIRYLDAGSRGQGGSGTRNFVVFPGEEKKVKILKRE